MIQNQLMLLTHKHTNTHTPEPQRGDVFHYSLCKMAPCGDSEHPCAGVALEVIQDTSVS